MVKEVLAVPFYDWRVGFIVLMEIVLIVIIALLRGG